MVLVTLLVAAASITGLWIWGERKQVSTAETYWPLQNGFSSFSRVTEADGMVSYAGTNATEDHASELIRDGHYLLLSSLVKALGLDVSGDQIVLDQLGQARVARVHDVQMAGSLITPTESVILALPQQLALVQVASGDVTAIFDPPVALLRSGMSVASTAIQTGLVSYPAYTVTLTYTAILTYEAAEAVQVPAGSFDDCQRILLRLQIGHILDSSSRVWYCRGVGNVKQMDLDSQGALLRSFEAVSLHSQDYISAQNNGVSLPPTQSTASALTQSRWPVAASGVLTEVWRAGTGDGVATVMAEPVIVDSLDLVLITTYRGDLTALNRADGALVWRFRAGGPIYGAPVVRDGVAYFGSSDRHVYAVDVRTGTYRWSFAVGDILSSSPVMEQGVVYAGSQDRTLYALDAATGRLLRRFDVGGVISTSPLVADGVVYVGSDDGAVYALNAADFSVRWVFAAGNAIAAAPLLADDVLYIATQGGALMALNARTARAEGEVLWDFQTRNPASANMCFQNGMLYLTTSNALYAIDTALHAAKWRYTESIMYGTPIIMDDVLMAQTAQGVVAIDAATGALWHVTHPVESSPNAGLSTDGQRIYVGYFDGLLLALGRTTQESQP